MAAAERVLVIGASTNTGRYSALAIRMLLDHGHVPVAIGARPGSVHDVDILTEVPEGPFDTVTMYIRPSIQAVHRHTILARAPKRVIFNPGTENPAFQNELRDHGIDVLEACTLVLLRTGQY